MITDVDGSKQRARPHRIFLVGLAPLAVGIPIAIAADQIDSNLAAALSALAFAVDFLWIIYLSNK